MKRFIRKCKYSAEAVYIFAQFNKMDKARERMFFHEMKIAVQVALCILLGQGIILTLLWIF